MVPVRELLPDLRDWLVRSEPRSLVSFDVLYALANPAIAAEACRLLEHVLKISEIVEHVVAAVGRRLNGNAARDLSVLLAGFDRHQVIECLNAIPSDAYESMAAEKLQRVLDAAWSDAVWSGGPVSDAPGSGVPTPSATRANSYRSGYAAFTNDHVPMGSRNRPAKPDDSLNVGEHADHLAQLIAARDTSMPLSIGLFGPWGAGKSSFMDLLDDRLQQIAGSGSKVFHKNIIQIHFNAWHYLDTNLWANLVCHIFDQLFVHLNSSTDDGAEAKAANLKTKLVDESALAQEARQELTKAKERRKAATTALNEAVLEHEDARHSLRVKLDDLTSILKSNEGLQNKLKTLGDDLGMPALAESYDELEARVKEARSLGGRLKTTMVSICTGRGAWWRIALVLLLLAVPVLVSSLFAQGASRLSGVAEWIAQLTVWIGGLSSWIALLLRKGSSWVLKLENAYRDVKKAREADGASGDIKIARDHVVKTTRAEEKAKESLDEIESRIRTIHAELAELTPGRQLFRFLKDRTAAEDYRRHLGLVNLVRQDFERLSRLLDEADKQQQNDLPRIDRIVLYIDDLDRCRAERVIEVLEAVHLLLAFRLFAVVVAVDPRWLRQSLLDRYPKLLGAPAVADPHSNGGPSRTRPATPQDYLEKIFQVPFNLQPLQRDGYAALIGKLFPLGKEPTKESGTRASPMPEWHDATANVDLAVKPGDSTPENPQEAPLSVEPIVLRTTSQAELTVDPERLAFSQHEIDDILRFQSFFQTPRAVKRFANTYALIRVGVGVSLWESFLGDKEPGEYRIPMLLLAVTSAYPSLARAFLEALEIGEHAEWNLSAVEFGKLSDRNQEMADIRDWELLVKRLQKLVLPGWPRPEKESLARWMPRVARYSF